jgi:2-dehydropantoate 2-reductase
MPERAPAPQPLRFLFFGAGAVGSLLGARLAQAGSEVTLVGRQPHVEAVTRDGVRMVTAGKVSNQSVRAARPSVAEAGGPFDYVFLTVKGYDTLDAIEQLQPVLRPGTILGSFQNGVGNEEAIAAALPEQALMAGSLTVPVSLDEPGTIKLHSRRGGVALAPVSPEVNVAPLVRKLHAAGFKARRYTDFRAMKWSKLLFNILGNAQSAILDLPPSHVFADSELFRYERAAFQEAVAVMDRMHLKVVALPGLPAGDGSSPATRPDAARTATWGREGQQDAVPLVGPEPRQVEDGSRLPERGGR